MKDHDKNPDSELINVLGYGTLGEVCCLHDHKANKYIAAKNIYISLLRDKEKVANIFEQLSKLKNPAILEINDFNKEHFLNETYPKISTDYMQKGSIDKRVKSFTNTNKYINLLGIALVMHYLHSNKILHLNLQPENILLDDNLYPHISDFGIAEITGNNVFRKGTPIFSSPEIFEGKNINSKSDVYSYSLIAYLIITGDYPNIEGDSFSLMQNIIKGKRPNLKNIQNKKIKIFLQKCWSQNHEDRPSFDKIIEFLCDENFYSSFGINLKAVSLYLTLFDKTLECTTNLTSNVYFEYSIALLGQTEVGKSSLCSTYYHRVQPTTLGPTTGFVFYDMNVRTDKGVVKLSVRDVGGQERFQSLLPLYIRGSNAAIFVTDVTIPQEY